MHIKSVGYRFRFLYNQNTILTATQKQTEAKRRTFEAAVCFARYAFRVENHMASLA